MGKPRRKILFRFEKKRPMWIECDASCLALLYLHIENAHWHSFAPHIFMASVAHIRHQTPLLATQAHIHKNLIHVVWQNMCTRKYMTRTPFPPKISSHAQETVLGQSENGLPKEPRNGSGSVSKTLIFRAGMFRGCVLRTFCFYYKKRFRCCVLQGFMRAPFFLKRVRAHKPS